MIGEGCRPNHGAVRMLRPLSKNVSVPRANNASLCQKQKGEATRGKVSFGQASRQSFIRREGDAVTELSQTANGREDKIHDVTELAVL